MTVPIDGLSSSTKVQIRAATIEDSSSIASIYNEFITHSTATFELDPVPDSEMATRISTLQGKYPWLVAIKNNSVIGYAYASSWKLRAAYRHTVESTIYLHPEHRQQGVGEYLYNELLQILALGKYHSVIAGIALPNPASIHLHEKLGFQKVAHFREVGFKYGQWVDVGYWELILRG